MQHASRFTFHVSQGQCTVNKFDVRSAQEYAAAGRLEEWIHGYLNTGPWANEPLSLGLKLQQRWWRGPLEVRLADLDRVVGPEPGMEYVVASENWEERTRQLAHSFTNPLALPPLIVEYRQAALSIRDGNHRYGAMQRLGWPACWVLIWYNSEDEYQRHTSVDP
jgi:hypothetical protein